MKTAHSASDTWIALDKAVGEFGPCEGGYDKARVRILREISSNPEFDFKLNGKPPKANWAKGFEGNVREWFGELAEAASQDASDTELLKWLNGEEGPQVNFAQTRSIWIVEKPEGWVSNADLNDVWNELEALAWIATQDSHIVGLAQKMQNSGKTDQFIGLIDYIVSNKCRYSQHENSNDPKWLSCRCINRHSDQLRRFSRGKAQNQATIDGNFSILRYDIENGSVQFKPSSNTDLPYFLKKHVLQFFSSTDPSSPLAQEMERLQSHQTNTGSPGRPPIGKPLYMAEFRRRLKADEWINILSEESRYLQDWFSENHPLKASPSLKTIENAIRDEFNKAKAASV
jgi:hypothetical protein